MYNAGYFNRGFIKPITLFNTLQPLLFLFDSHHRRATIICCQSYLQFAVSNLPGSLFPSGKIAPGKLATNSL